MIDVVAVGFAPDLLDYEDGLALQRRVHRDVVGGVRPDALLLCEHRAVYTAGTRTEPSDRPTPSGGPADPTPVIDVDRGGRITWHGPGQLTGYPIVRLAPVGVDERGRERVDVVRFVRDLESMLIALCAAFGVEGRRVDGRSGVWADSASGPEKVAAIGLRVSEGVTMHGFAVNCDNDLAPYGRIVPCGIADAGVTTLSRLAGVRIRPTDVEPLVGPLFDEHVRRAAAGVAA
jgi:lipoyl(octanoyl) transferase